MKNVTAHLLGLPVSPAADSNNARARRFAHTTDGRGVLRRFAAEVATLVETEDARRCLARAEQADEWQPAFEAAVDAQRELSMALWGEAGPPEYSGGPQAQRDAWSAQNDALELLSRRLLDVARGGVSLTLRSYIEQLLDLEEELGTDRVQVEAIVQPNYPMIAHLRGLAWTQNEDGSVSVYLQLGGNSDYAPREFDEERRLELGDGRPV